jgi:hypothetical protein
LDRAQDYLAPFASLRAASASTLTLFSFVGEDFRAVGDNQSTNYESIRAGAAGQPLEKLFVYGSFIIDEALAQSPSYTGKKWRGFAGDVQDAFGHFHSKQFDLTIGRFSSVWGIRNSLILSSEQRLDGLAYTFRWGRLVLSYRFARLDGLSPERDSVAQFENRYFAAHRLDFHFSPRLRVGLFETVLFGGPGRQIDIFYLNPILFYHGSQLNEGTNDNTTVGFDFAFKPITGLKLWGQALIDDYQIDSETQADQEPAEIAFVVGSYVADIFRLFDIRAEYQHVTNWTFNQTLERNRYLHRNEPIGTVLGNDYDYTSISFIRWLRPLTAARLTLTYHRQGEGRINAEWTEPWTTAEGDYSESFPTGQVQNTATASIGAKTFLFNHLYLDLEGGYEWTENDGHIAGTDRTSPFVRLVLSGFLFTGVGLE